MTCYETSLRDIQEQWDARAIGIVPIAADNHCLYRAMAIFAGELGEDHAGTDLVVDEEARDAVVAMRDTIATEIETSYKGLTQQQKADQRARMYQFQQQTDQKKYTGQIRNTSKWGGELEIAAFSRLNPDRCIIVIDVRTDTTEFLDTAKFYSYGNPTAPVWLLIRRDDSHFEIGRCRPRWETMDQVQVQQKYGMTRQNLVKFTKTCRTVFYENENVGDESLAEYYRQYLSGQTRQERDKIWWTAALVGTAISQPGTDLARQAEKGYVMSLWHPGYGYDQAAAIMKDFWRALDLPDKPEGVDRFYIKNTDDLSQDQARLIRASEHKNLVLNGLSLFLGCYVNDLASEFTARDLEEKVVLDHARRLMPPNRLVKDMLGVLIFLCRDTGLYLWNQEETPRRVEFMTRNLAYFYFCIVGNLPKERGPACDDLRDKCREAIENPSDTSSTLERLMAYRLLLRIDSLPPKPRQIR